MQRDWRRTAVRGSRMQQQRAPSEWRPVAEEANRAVAVFGFDPEQARAALAFSMESPGVGAGGVGGADMLLPLFVGDVVTLLQECEDGWYLGHSVGNPGHKGVFPRSYVTSLRKEDRPPIVDEISSVLREWNTHLREKFRQSGDTVHAAATLRPPDQQQLLQPNPLAIPVTPMIISGHMNTVMTARRQLVGQKLTHVEAEEEQRKVTTKIDFLNRQLGMDLVVRDERGNRLTGASDSAVAFYRQHKGSAEKSFGDGRMTLQHSEQVRTLGSAPAVQQRPAGSFRIMMEVKNFISQKISDFVELDFSIYEASREGRYNMKPLCENFVAYLTGGPDRKHLDDPRRSHEELERRSNLRVLFTDIGKSDIKNQLFLVCKVVSEGGGDVKHPTKREEDGKSLNGSVLDLRQPEHDSHFRRPLGVAAVDITDLFTFKQSKAVPDGEKEMYLNFMQMGGDEFVEDVFRKLVFDERVPTEANFLWVTLNVMLGDPLQPPEMRNLRHPVARKIGHPEVILPSDERNELFLTLWSGDFTRPTKSLSDRNVEVIVKVCDRQGNAVADSISSGVGAACPGESYRSLVFMRNQRPRWNEVTKITIDAHKFSECHLQFTFWHRSEKKKENREPFAMSFLKLEQHTEGGAQVEDQSNTALKDDRYTLIVYKMEKNTRLDPTAYLKIPYLKKQERLRQIKKTNNLTLLPNDEMVVITTLCSTKLTQNEGLRSLLEGKGDKVRLRSNLMAFKHDFDGREFVKFLPEAMDTLFSLLTETAESDEDVRKVFEHILYALQQITDDKNQQFRHFLPVLDEYIATKFSATLAYSKLLEILKECVEDADTKSKELTDAMKSFK